ncbi:MAG: T9SS type A sorting domain-containing protein [Lewinellaceae bacterium]|nr:T9SS type A sorting domain-containing protein [Lewinellaceae bacterium]
MKSIYTLFFLFSFTPFLLSNTCSTATPVSLNATWQALFDDQFDGQDSWYVFTPPQNGTLQLCQAASYFIYDNCTNGDPYTALYPSTTSTSCGGNSGFNIAELNVSAGNAVYIIVQAGFAGSTVNVRFLTSFSSNCGSTCYENPNLYGGQTVQCDNFETYTSNQFITPQSPDWIKWSTGAYDAEVRTYLNINEQYLRVEHSGGIDPDVIYYLGNRTSGRYRLSWEMNVATGRSAYYNLLHTLPNSSGSGANRAYQVYFNSDGSAILDRPGLAVNFTYLNGDWNRVMQIIDMDDDLVEFWINDEFIDSWPFSNDISSTAGANRLAGINFYAFAGLGNDADNLYAIDNVCLWEVQGCTCPQDYNPVCVKNGVEYYNGCAANCSGYIPNEWDAGSCNPVANDCSQAVPIQCGQTLANQTTVNQGNNFNSADFENCLSSSFTFNGPDRVYELTIFQERQVKIFLDILNSSDLDIFLLDQCDDPQQFIVNSLATNCIASSAVDNISYGVYKEAIDIILSPGVYYIVVDGKESSDDGPFNLFVSCDCECSEPTGNQPIGAVNLCDNLEDYDLARLAPQSTRWRLFYSGADDAAVFSQNGNQYVKIEETAGSASDLLYLLDDLNAGRYRLSWNMRMENGKEGYYNIQHAVPNADGSGANWAYNVYFNTDGTGYLRLGGDNNAYANFNYNTGTWNNVMQIIDINQDVAELWINHNFVASWNFSQGWNGNNVQNSSQLSAINFYANSNNSYWVDDICLWKVGIDCAFFTCGGEEPVCGKNGLQYGCVSRARCEGYISSEWERCFSICDYGGTFVYRTDLFTDTMRVTDLAPPLLRQESCIQNSYDFDIPANFYADIYVFYNDDGEDVFIDDAFMSDNTKFFVFSCDCTGAICTQSCLGQVGVDFDGAGLPEGFYYVVATNTAPEAYGFMVTPDGDCASGVPTLTFNNATPGDLSTTPSGYDNGGVAGFDAYDDCYNGNRGYSGGDDVYRFVLEEPSPVSITLQSNEPMGVFLYNYLCARNCMGYAETGPQGGQVSLDSLSLLDGVYYLIVDKDTPGGDGSYSLRVDSLVTGRFLISTFNDADDFVPNCPADQATTHMVNIPETAFPFTQRHRLSFLVFDNDVPRALEGPSAFWNGDDAMDFEIPKDLDNDAFKCAYVEDDEILLYLMDLSGSNFNGSLCELEYLPAGTGGTTAEGLFTPGAVSQITQITRLEVDNARLSSVFETVPAAGDTFNIQVLTDQNWSVREIPEVPWLRVDPTNSDGAENIRIEVDPNPTSAPRDVLLQFRFEGSVTTFQSLAIEQLGICVTPEVSIASGLAGDVLCAGQDATLTAQIDPLVDGLYSIEWSTGGSSNTTTVSPVSDTQFSVTVTENNCFTSASATIDISVVGLPDAPESEGDATYCQGGAPVPLQVSSTAEVFWYNQPQGGAPIGSGLSFTPGAPGTYYAEAVAGPGCSSGSRTAVTLSETPAPTANAGADASICAGGSVTLNASATGGSGSGYQYEWSGGLPPVQDPVASPSTDIAYSLTVTDSNGCTDTDEVAVTVNELPVPAISAMAATCGLANGSAMASASSGQDPYTYTWSDGQTGPEATGLPAGPISVTVEDAFGCTASATATVGTIDGPSIFPINPEEICAGESVTLEAGASGGTGAYTFTWNQGLPNGPSQVVSPAATTTYEVTVTDLNDCSESTEVTVTVNPLPIADAGADGEICRGEEYLLEATAGSGTGNYTFHWSNGLGFGPEKLVSPLSTTEYEVSVTDDKGCMDTDMITLTVNQLPSVSISGEDAACGQDNGSATANPTGGTGPYSFLWSNGEESGEITGLASGSYSVTVTDLKGCFAAATVAISDQAGPVVDIPGVSQICAGDSINLIAVVLSGNGPYSYNWSSNLGTNVNIRVAPPSTTAYSVTVSDANDCIGIAQVTVPVAQRAMVNSGPNQNICLGDEVQLNGQIGGGAVSAEWDALISGGSFAPGPNALDAVFTPPANYTGAITFALTANAGAPCPSVLSYMVVDIKPLPPLDISDILCEPGYETYGFIAETDGSEFASSAGDWMQNGQGTYTVTNIPVGLDITATATNMVTGCETVAEIISPICLCTEEVPNPPESLGDKEICEGDPFPALEVSVGEGQTANWYATQTGNDDSPLAEGTTSYTPTAPGTYYAALVDIATECISTGRVAVTLSILAAPIADAGDGQTICPGEEVTLQAQEEPGYTYLWNTGENSASITVSPGTTTTYSLTVTNAEGCSAEDEAMITVTPAINASIVPLSEPACSGDTNGSLLIDASGGIPPLSYEWSTGSTMAAISGLGAGVYTVTVRDQAPCETSFSFEFPELEELTIELLTTVGDTNGLGTGELFIEANGGVPPYTFNWTGPGGFQSNEEDLSGLPAGNYFLELEDDQGCIRLSGPFTVPQIVGLDDTPGKQVSFQLYPNPTNNRVWLDVSLPEREDVQLEAFNPLGERILREIWRDVTEQRKELDFSAYPSGIYLIKLRHSRGIMAKYLVVQQN